MPRALIVGQASDWSMIILIASVVVVVKAKKPQTLEEAATQGDIAIGAIDDDKPEKPFDVVEQMPELPDSTSKQ